MLTMLINRFSTNTKILNKKNIKNFWGFIFIFLSIIYFFCVPEVALKGSRFGLALCFNTLIPSIFPFMVLSSLVVNLNICEKLSFILNPIMKFLFKLPGNAGATTLLGLVGGYQIGANGTKTLLENNLISKKQAKKMIYFIVGAGPTFTIALVGTQLLHNKRLGIILFISQIISSILIGFVMSFFSKDDINNTNLIKKGTQSFSQGLIKSTSDAADFTINMCAFVVLFSSFLEVIKNSRLNIYLEYIFLKLGMESSVCKSIIPIIFEVTNGIVAGTSYHIPIFLISFAISWAGLCIHFQIFYCLKDIEFSKFKFIVIRILQGFISGIVSYVLISFFLKDMQVSAIKIYSVGDSFFSLTSSGISIIFLCLCFLSTLTNKSVTFDTINHQIPIKLMFSKNCKKIDDK